VVSRDLELYRTLTNIVSVLDQSESQDGGELASFTDGAAIRQARALASRGLELLTTGEDVSPAGPDARSSVAIETMAKGEPKITIKAYSGSPIAPALEQAKEAWSQLLGELLSESRERTEGAQAS
jgi:hypothetical protein